MLLKLNKLKSSLSKNLNELDLHTSSIDRKLKPSKDWSGAVLMLIARDHLIYIRRSDEMPTHKGQMAFIGGHKNPEDRDPFHTAMREFKEETELDLPIELFGLLPVVYTAKMRIITPVLAYVDMDAKELVERAVSNGEWTNCIAAPVDYLADLNNWSWGNRVANKLSGQILFHTFAPNKVHVQKPLEKNALLWGASARMTWNFLNLYIKVGQN